MVQVESYRLLKQIKRYDVAHAWQRSKDVCLLVKYICSLSSNKEQMEIGNLLINKIAVF